MCTLTIQRTPGNALITMNRDEARTRAPERPPDLWWPDNGAAALLGPRDGHRGGTWLAVNDRGVAACLLNAYRPGETELPASPPGAPSRGDVIPRLLASGAFDAVHRTWTDGFDPSPYSPFTLVVVSLAGAFHQIWTGADRLPAVALNTEWTLLVSSSWHVAEVTAWRRGAFFQWRAAGAPMRGPLPALHLLQPLEEAAWSPLMDRDLSSTRSITQVALEAGRGEAILRYWPRAALPGGAPTTRELSLKNPGAT